MTKIGVVTVARSDYGIYRSILSAISADPELGLELIVSGTHLSEEFGHTVDLIRSDGFNIFHRVEMLRESDTPSGIVHSMARGIAGFSKVFEAERPEILLVLGDRFEMHAAALAALPFKIPVAHIHGGELTEGAIDDALRHSLTKLSHLHFPATQEYGRRIRQLGEEAWRVVVTGAPALDDISQITLWSPEEIAHRIGSAFDTQPLLVTYHPVTLEYENAEWQTEQLLSALDEFHKPTVFTAPNADTSGRVIRGLIERFVSAHSNAIFVENLGTVGYFSLMAHAGAMIGNSSSGIIEAPSFRLPVVNVGNRQSGRVRGENVIDVGYAQPEIWKGIRRALSDEFRAGLKGIQNPYDQGGAAPRIVAALKQFSPGSLIVKHFVDQGSTQMENRVPVQVDDCSV